MKAKKLLPFLLPALALAASGCGGGDFCSQIQSFSTKAQGCASGNTSVTVTVPPNCEANFAKCSAADQAKLNSYASCVGKLSACTPSTAADFAGGTVACAAQDMTSVSATCLTDLGMGASSSGGTSGTSSGGTNGSSTSGTGSVSSSSSSSGSTSGSTSGGSTSSTSSGGTSGVSSSGVSSSGNSSSGAVDAGCTPQPQPAGSACFYGQPAATDAGTPAAGDAGVQGLGTTCNPTAATDSCAQYGLVCNQNSSTCQMPSEFEPCSTTTGCATAQLKCMSGVFKSDACLYPCTTTADCPDPVTSCISAGQAGHVCIYSLCGPNAASFGGSANGTTYYAPCTNATSNDGTCIPAQTGGNPPDIGLCQLNGTAAAGQACSTQRSDAGTNPPLCANGGFCFAPSGNTGTCFSLCNASTNPATAGAACGPACPVGDGCLSAGPGSFWGLCLKSCTSASDCSGGLSCVQ